MTESPKLPTTKRDTTKAAELRRTGQLPAVIYGHKIANTPLAVNAKLFGRVFDEAGFSTLVELEIDNKPVKVLIQDVQLHPVTGDPIHADFYAVNLEEKVETEIPLKFVGESPAVEELEANFVQNKNEVEVRALPLDLVSEIEVDISSLKAFDDVIRAADLKIPEKLELLEDPDRVIALVTEPRSEEELAELEADTSAEEEAAVEELGKDKESEGEEGETAEGEEQAKEEPKEEKNKEE